MTQPQWRIVVGDVRTRLADLPDQSIQMVCTSPPYWGLRDYGTAEWDGGDPACEHLNRHSVQGTSGERADRAFAGSQNFYKDACKQCGARRIDAQIGLEATPDAYVAALVAVFRDVRRILKDDGVLWLNLGDCYASTSTYNAPRTSNGAYGRAKAPVQPNAGIPAGLKPKDLVGIPWLVAFALQADGWYLRSDIIWAKPNPMPESVTDRPTKAHEYIFLLTKNERYFYDADAIAEPASLAMIAQMEQGYDGLGLKDYGGAGVQNPSTVKTRIIANAKRKQDALGKSTYSGFNDRYDFQNPSVTRNARSVWTITTQPYPDAHFATFPEAIPERCIKAGSRIGDTVLDPFTGSGTTGQVAIHLGRSFIGIELNPSYAALARTRIGGAAPLFAVEVI